MKIIVDSNILFSALLSSENKSKSVLFNPNINESMIPRPIFQTAFELCQSIDEKDTPFLALCLFMEAKLLTGDRTLIKGLRNKGFNAIVELNEL